MAFIAEDLSLIVQPIAGVGLRMFSYRTDDSRLTLETADYIPNATRYGVRADDLIFVVQKSVSADPYIMVVASIDASDNATLVLGDGLEAVSTVTPEMFGATRFTGVTSDLSTLADSTAALVKWNEYIEATGVIGALTSLYKSTSALSFTKDGTTLRGISARDTGILFSGCAGLELDIEGGNMSRYSVTDFAVLTDSDRALGYFGLEITCDTSNGGADAYRNIERMYFGGQRIFEVENETGIMAAENAVNRKQGWLRAISLNGSDNTVVRDNRIHGPIWDWNSSYRPPNGGVYISYGIWATDSTSLELVSNKILFPTYGVRVAGACEGSLVTDNVVGAGLGGYLFEAFSGAANWHKIHRNHASCHEFGISYNMDGSAPGISLWPEIQGNLIFMTQGTNFGDFTHIRVRTSDGLVIGNKLRIAPSDDATVATGLVAQGIYLEGNQNAVLANVFTGLDRMIDIVSGSEKTLVALNVTHASDALSSAPYSDAGTDTIFFLNTGDAKSGLWPPPRLTANKTVAQLAALTPYEGATAFCTNETGGAVPVFGDGTNWRRVTDRAVVS